MTTSEVNKARNEKGIFSAANECAGWYAVSREGIHMISYADATTRFYTEKGFARRITQLLNRGY
jgi:hypothetical protein